jgi:hypothetical protein
LARSTAAAQEASGFEKGQHLSDAAHALVDTVDLAHGGAALLKGVASLGRARLAALKVKSPAPAEPPRVCAAGTCGNPDVVCFVAGTKVKTSEGYVDIESITIGDRVLTDAECSGTKVDEASWAAITLAMPNPDRPGDVIDLHLLRPRSWLAEQGAGQDSLVEIHLEEMQLSGLARVVAIDRVPPLADGPGCLVLSTVTHLNGDVLELRFENSGTVLQPTARHHLHSYDTRDWVRAGDLRPGDRLTTSSGHVTVASVVSKPGLHRVFNIEVETQHAYYVSSLDVFSHNTGACGPRNDPALGGFSRPVLPDEIRALNGSFGGSVELNGTIEGALAAAGYYGGFYRKAAALIRGIAHGHLFDNGNKRTASAVLELLRQRNGITSGVTSERARRIIHDVATGCLHDIDEIADSLKGF